MRLLSVSQGQLNRSPLQSQRHSAPQLVLSPIVRPARRRNIPWISPPTALPCSQGHFFFRALCRLSLLFLPVRSTALAYCSPCTAPAFFVAAALDSLHAPSVFGNHLGYIFASQHSQPTHLDTLLSLSLSLSLPPLLTTHQLPCHAVDRNTLSFCNSLLARHRSTYIYRYISGQLRSVPSFY
ncbi:hypothetical protein VTO42DRAFT_5375 [Malbranchea cinnamomea]